LRCCGTRRISALQQPTSDVSLTQLGYIDAGIARIVIQFDYMRRCVSRAGVRTNVESERRVESKSVENLSNSLLYDVSGAEAGRLHDAIHLAS
jgi:hypothetical protein